MHTEAESLMNVPLKELRDKEAEGRAASEERLTRLLYHVDDLERRLSYLESLMDEQLDRRSQIHGDTASTVSTLASDTGERGRLFSQLMNANQQRRFIN